MHRGSHESMTIRAVLAVLFASITGCGGAFDATLSGNVSYRGQPLATGTVTFHPKGEGPISVGSIRDDGGYEVVTGREIGLPPGDYQVTVVANGPLPEPTPENPEPLPELLVPARYTVKQTSGLSYTVTSGDNVYDIELSE